jgi:acetylornithine/succinyldiaminopimelate/putrescine aminotransferase
MASSPAKQSAIEAFRGHVSSGKAAFFEKYGMDFVMGKREGPYFWDMDGEKKVFDCHTNGGVFNLGHRNAELIEILKQSLDSLDIGNHHLLSAERADLARYLAGLLPADLSYTVFGVSGGEAIDLAIKVARAYSGRTTIISARGGYHGHTGLALAAGDEKFRAPFGPAAPGFRQVSFGDPVALDTAADDQTAGVLLETIPATLGMVIPPPGYLQAVRRLCTDRGVLLILDEVQSGLGRTGKLWAFEHFDIAPDILVLGKGLSGGLYPISATVLKRPLESVFHEDPFIHISTFGGAEVGCHVAKRVLEISSSPEFLSHVNNLSALFSGKVRTLQKKHGGFLTGFRQLGLMMGLKLRDELSGPLLTKTAYDHGLLLVYAGNDTSVCQLLPPLTISHEDVDRITERLDGAIASARRLKPILKLKRSLENPRLRVKEKN